MGRMKDGMMRDEEMEAAARRVALKAGAISRCAVHSDIVIDNFDAAAVEDAHKIGKAMVHHGEVEASVVEFLEAIDRVVGESCDECYACHRD
jgi:hypothetical protein